MGSRNCQNTSFANILVSLRCYSIWSWHSHCLTQRQYSYAENGIYLHWSIGFRVDLRIFKGLDCGFPLPLVPFLHFLGPEAALHCAEGGNHQTQHTSQINRQIGTVSCELRKSTKIMWDSMLYIGHAILLPALPSARDVLVYFSSSLKILEEFFCIGLEFPQFFAPCVNLGCWWSLS